MVDTLITQEPSQVPSTGSPPPATSASAASAQIRPAGGASPARPDGLPMTLAHRRLVTVYSLFSVAACGFLLLLLSANPGSLALGITARSILLGVLLGAAMGAVHGLASIAVHAGNGDLGEDWVLFYICRPFTGAGVALVTCLLLVSGVGGFSLPDDLDRRKFVLLAWSALAGLFSQQALSKLRDLFASLFSSREDNESAGRTSGNAKAGAPPISGTEASTAGQGSTA